MHHALAYPIHPFLFRVLGATSPTDSVSAIPGVMTDTDTSSCRDGGQSQVRPADGSPPLHGPTVSAGEETRVEQPQSADSTA